eukprot:TRINITY_DN4004_c1_g1_i1.p2 TRINITY_DN4004_c1_g1~~TRINITY_DN4004_c1_g1_i1.p2  ORF type:complete len:119 (-),score=19.35 TRINITY_DN4004_c1_g1_i1:33-389(-)
MPNNIEVKNNFSVVLPPQTLNFQFMQALTVVKQRLHRTKAKGLSTNEDGVKVPKTCQESYICLTGELPLDLHEIDEFTHSFDGVNLFGLGEVDVMNRKDARKRERSNGDVRAEFLKLG